MFRPHLNALPERKAIVNLNKLPPKRSSMLLAIASAMLLTGWASASMAEDVNVRLSGDQEVPAVKTAASGSGTFRINDDKTVSGSVQVSGMDAVAAHIHQAAAGQNGPVIIPLSKGSSNNEWSVGSGAKLSDEQYKVFKDGGLYVNVHSKAHQGGEIRAQLKP
jgi:hypothetical protein